MMIYSHHIAKFSFSHNKKKITHLPCQWTILYHQKEKKNLKNNKVAASSCKIPLETNVQ